MKKLKSRENPQWLTVSEATERFNVSRGMLLKIAADKDAIVRFGTRFLRIDAKKLEA